MKMTYNVNFVNFIKTCQTFNLIKYWVIFSIMDEICLPVISSLISQLTL